MKNRGAWKIIVRENDVELLDHTGKTRGRYKKSVEMLATHLAMALQVLDTAGPEDFLRWGREGHRSIEVIRG